MRGRTGLRVVDLAVHGRSSRPDAPPSPPSAAPAWRLAWLPPSRIAGVPQDTFVFLGAHGEGDSKEVATYWAVEVGDDEAARVGGAGDGSAFVDWSDKDAMDWSDKDAMEELAIAGHARALLEWHSMAKFCGACGAKAVPTEAGRRKQCSNESYKKRIYPRVDPVVIMLVIYKENDRALLSRQSRFVPRMWSCIAGFIENRRWVGLDLGRQISSVKVGVRLNNEIRLVKLLGTRLGKM